MWLDVTSEDTYHTSESELKIESNESESDLKSVSQ